MYNNLVCNEHAFIYKKGDMSCILIVKMQNKRTGE